MKHKTLKIILTLAALAAFFFGSALFLPAKAGHPEGPGSGEVASSPGQVKPPRPGSVMFIENVGQFPEGARFQVWGGSHTVWLTDEAIWIVVWERKSSSVTRSPLALREGMRLRMKGEGGESEGVALKLSFPGSNPHLQLEPFDRLDIVISYFLGNDPGKWRTHVPVWGGVRYKDLYPGVDLVLAGEGGRWTWRLLVRNRQFPLSDVRLRVEGAEELRVEGNCLLIATAVGEFAFPLLDVVGPDGRQIPGQAPKVRDKDVLAPFAVGSSPPPSHGGDVRTTTVSSLAYSTFFGGSGDDVNYSIITDAGGSAYFIGATKSLDFPTTPGAFDPTHNAYYDAFVAKLNPAGSAPSYATFLGGSYDDLSGAEALFVDPSGIAYIAGISGSPDFPTTVGAYDETYNGYGDVFVTKLSADGSALIYSTFIGGIDYDYGYTLAVDSQGSVVVGGETYSSDYPVTQGCYDSSFNGESDAFVTKLSPAGNSLVYSTFLGGASYDWATAITLDAAGYAYIEGDTYSSNFPITPGAFDGSYGGDGDVFVAKLNPTGSALSYSTFLGGSTVEWSEAIALDAENCAYVTGGTLSSDFPVSTGAFDTTFGGMSDAFVTKLNPTGSGLIYSTFLGGSDVDAAWSLLVDPNRAVYLSGITCSSDFPTTADALDRSFNGEKDAFIAKLDSSGSLLQYSTFLGGSKEDKGAGITLDNKAAIYNTGTTFSPDFPTTSGAFDRTCEACPTYSDGFVIKLIIRKVLYLPLVPKKH